MTTIEYDLDLTGGFIEEINRLVAPPQSETRTKRHRVKERNHFRRPGKLPNHDCCDSCKEGGDLLCCDRCPAAFHLQCHDQPLEEDDVPPGEWLCHRCRMKPLQEVNQDDETSSSCSSKSRQSETSHPLVSKKLNVTKIIRSIDGDYSDLDFTDITEEEKQNPLKMLAKASRILNPKQFELPKDVTCPYNFPGSSKIGSVRGRKSGRETSRPAKSVITKTDSGLIPLPVKLCFVCSRSCRVAALLQCDYCSLVFHLDCLNPPLTVVPSGRWMCPNHVEHILDEKFLDSVRITERIQLWDKFAGPIDAHTVKLQFLKKIHRHNPPFRLKTKCLKRLAVKVPNAIKSLYANRPSFFPAAVSTVREQSLPEKQESHERLDADEVGTSDQAQELKHESEERLQATADEQEQWLKGVMKLHQEISRHLQQKSNTTTASSSCSDISINNTSVVTSLQPYKPIASVVPVVITCEPVERSNPESDDNITDPSNVTQTVPSAVSPPHPPPQSPADVSHQITENNSTVKEEPMDVEEDCVNGSEFHVNISRNGQIQSCLGTSSSEKMDVENCKSFSTFSRDCTSVVSVSRQKENSVLDLCPGCNDMSARAVLCSLPTSSKFFAIPLVYRTLMIGTGEDMDLCLTKFGHCNYVSPKHACIFFDELSGQYELLNYSEHGTTVDNVLYSCDFSVKTPVKPVSAKQGSGLRRQQMPVSLTKHVDGVGENGTIKAHAYKLMKPCRCKSDYIGLVRENSAGWEGSAILNHSSYIKIGCMEFVFSIVDQAPTSTDLTLQTSLRISDDNSMTGTSGV